MDRLEISNMLKAQNKPAEIAKWLRLKYLPEIRNRFNTDDSRKRFGLYQGENLPSNERNLTDVRTRMGVLIEFEVARISNELLKEYDINDIFWSYVVANKFPDLEVRENNGNRLLRLEMKALECRAEEKSANFDTLIKDINPNTDFVIVALWEWQNNKSNDYQWDSVPVIFNYYVFNAYMLAKMRDTYWLNNPPKDLGDGYQGFDIRYPVTCKNGIYSKEQGNLGKLTRIWKEDFQYIPNDIYELFNDTQKEYIKFLNEIIWTGFEIISREQLSILSNECIHNLLHGEKHVGYFAEQYGYLIDTNKNRKMVKEIFDHNNLNYIIKMNEKYKGSIWYKDATNNIQQLGKEIKPKSIIRFLFHHQS